MRASTIYAVFASALVASAKPASPELPPLPVIAPLPPVTGSIAIPSAVSGVVPSVVGSSFVSLLTVDVPSITSVLPIAGSELSQAIEPLATLGPGLVPSPLVLYNLVAELTAFVQAFQNIVMKAFPDLSVLTSAEGNEAVQVVDGLEAVLNEIRDLLPTV